MRTFSHNFWCPNQDMNWAPPNKSNVTRVNLFGDTNSLKIDSTIHGAQKADSCSADQEIPHFCGPQRVIIMSTSHNVSS
jgi:hypothetical protein